MAAENSTMRSSDLLHFLNLILIHC